MLKIRFPLIDKMHNNTSFFSNMNHIFQTITTSTLCPKQSYALHEDLLKGLAAMICIFPYLLKSCKSAFEGFAITDGWLCTVPTMLKSIGRIWSWNIAWESPNIIINSKKTAKFVWIVWFCAFQNKIQTLFFYFPLFLNNIRISFSLFF